MFLDRNKISLLSYYTNTGHALGKENHTIKICLVCYCKFFLIEKHFRDKYARFSYCPDGLYKAYTI